MSSGRRVRSSTIDLGAHDRHQDLETCQALRRRGCGSEVLRSAAARDEG